MNYVDSIRQLVGHTPLILAGSCGVLVDPTGRLLLQHRNEPEARWGLLGGLMELGESTAQTLIREVHEESGLRLDPAALTLLGVYSGMGPRTAPNGDVFYSVITAYIVRNVTAQPVVADAETLAFAWFAPADLPRPLADAHRLVLADYLKQL
ncbi:NUDIX domain-containing protein [Lacticaseibacillus absianus]|uniref:NUDIX domain-containing protein n=1 Tax=Lacticaseibacillus absianus TaxID=2729623 RepID=UPI0015CECBD0|nr:NUDIX domain-containing protein [Lacticaseibacillus absianus]